ncbi:MAG: hypothetical protein KF687_06345 [Cyclobacteriaceae bacterium]|nr:hypothetical protein [Cyclobacteriaceae bacterium]
MAAANSTYPKVAVQSLNEALCFVSSSVVADSFVLRNRHLRVAANRYRQYADREIKNQKINRLLTCPQIMTATFDLFVSADSDVTGNF